MKADLMLLERTLKRTGRLRVRENGHHTGAADALQVTAALDLLIAHRMFRKLVREMTAVVDNYDHLPMAYAGDLEPLNVLLDVGVQSPRAFERLMRLAEGKREIFLHGKKTEYQREIMQSRRARLYKALELQELLRGPIARAVDREDYMKSAHRRWMEEKRKAMEGLDWKARVAATQDFWAQIDANLERNLAEARRLRRH